MTAPLPPTTLAFVRAMPARIDVGWLFSTPGGAHTRWPRIDRPSYEELHAQLETASCKALSRNSESPTTRSGPDASLQGRPTACSVEFGESLGLSASRTAGASSR